MLFYMQGNCPDEGRPFLCDMEAEANAKAKPEAKLRLLSVGRAASRLGDPTDLFCVTFSLSGGRLPASGPSKNDPGRNASPWEVVETSGWSRCEKIAMSGDRDRGFRASFSVFSCGASQARR